IITDYHLADIDGKNLLDRVKDLYPEVIRIAFSDRLPREYIVTAINRGTVHRFLLKPWSNDELRHIVQDICQQHTA
ncbi:MAG: c-di-GMP phosphodiesterase, partial [Gammaproteobacteria bacterium]|nr:c-di-GMP phosphodiesterase [Gammaproteobacteria bacterium]